MTLKEIHDEKYEEVTQKATRGMGWNYLSFGLSKALNLITISVLAHILSPDTFGIVALATLAIDILSIINDLGLGAALIQRQDNIEEASNTAFSLNIMAGAVLTVVTYMIAPLAAVFFREPMVTPVLRTLGLTFIIYAIGSVHNVRLQRDLNFRKRVIPEFGNSLIKAVVSIGMALAGFDVWSLVIGQLVGTSTATIALWAVFPWRPKLSWNNEIARELFKYGSSIMGINALSALEDNLDYFLIGRFYDTNALGLYTLGYRLPEVLVINVLWVMTAVLFPTFASLQDQREALKRSFLSTMRYVQILVTPVCLGIFIAADPIVRVVFGEQWLQSIPIMQILSIYAWLISIGFHTGDIYKAIGRPDLLVKLSIPIFIVRVIALWIGAQYSIVGVAFGHLVAGLVTLVVEIIVAKRILNITIKNLMAQLSAFVGGIALVALSLPVLYFTAELAPLARLIMTMIAGAAGYLTVIWFIEKDSVLRGLELVGISQFTMKKSTVEK